MTLHFQSKNDILYLHCATLLGEMAEDMKNFLGKKQDQLLYQHVGTVVHDDLPVDLDRVSEFSQYAYYFTLGGLWQALVLWIRTGMKQTPEQLTRYILESFTEMQKLI